MIEVQTQKIIFHEKKVLDLLEKKAPKGKLSIRNIIYYPYMFYEFSFQNKNPISPLKGDIGCTIDTLSGVPALVDNKPSFIHLRMKKENLLPIQLKENQTKDLAKEFLYRTVSKKIKVMTAPNLSMKTVELFYRPYWIIDGKEEQHAFSLMVDSISGKYHPLNVD